MKAPDIETRAKEERDRALRAYDAKVQRQEILNMFERELPEQITISTIQNDRDSFRLGYVSKYISIASLLKLTFDGENNIRMTIHTSTRKSADPHDINIVYRRIRKPYLDSENYEEVALSKQFKIANPDPDTFKNIIKEIEQTVLMLASFHEDREQLLHNPRPK